MKSEYLKLADTIAAEIADGTLKAGDRLPPQRNFAWERKIAVSTASRVYSELLRRGLVVGEVGRGTFISGDAKRGVTAPSEPSGIRIDLEFNYPLRPDQTAIDRKEPRRTADGRGARNRVAAGDHDRNAGGPQRRGRPFVARAVVAVSRSAGVHRQRAAKHCRRACQRRPGRRPLRRRAFDLPLRQGHRGPARYFTGAARDGRGRRAARTRCRRRIARPISRPSTSSRWCKIRWA